MQFSSKPFGAIDELRERVKHHDNSHVEEEPSQPSTMHSLGNLDDNSSPNQTPSKLSQFSQNIKQEAKEHLQASKAKFIERFGKMINPEEDLDEECQKNVKRINEAIKRRGHSEEVVIETQGTAVPKWKLLSDQAHDKITEVKDMIDLHFPQLRESTHKLANEARNQLDQLRGKILFTIGEKVDAARDLDESMKQQLKKVNQELRQRFEATYLVSMTHEERVIETQGQAEPGYEIEGPSSKKTDKMREQVHEFSQQVARKVEQVKGKAISHVEDLRHHHLKAGSKSFEPTEESRLLAEKVKEGLREPHASLVEKVEEAETLLKHEHSREKEEKPKRGEIEKDSKKKEETGNVPVERGSEKPVEESERVPLIDRVMGKIHSISENIHQTLEEMKDALRVEEKDQEEEYKGEKEGQSNPSGTRQPFLDKVMGGIHRLSTTIKERMSMDNLEGPVEKSPDVPRRVDNEDLTNERPSEDQEEEPGEILMRLCEENPTLRERIREGFHHITERISHGVESVKGRLSSGKKREALKEKPVESGEGGFHRVREGFSETVDEFEGKQKLGPLPNDNPFQQLAEEDNPGSPSPKNESEKEEGIFSLTQTEAVHDDNVQQGVEKYFIGDLLSGGIQLISHKIAQNIEGLKGRLSAKKEKKAPAEPQIEATGSSEPSQEEMKPQAVELFEREIDSGKNGVSSERSAENKENVKRGSIPQAQSEYELHRGEFHSIKRGFSESVEEYEKEQRGPAVVSENPFEFEKERRSQQARKREVGADITNTSN